MMKVEFYRFKFWSFRSKRYDVYINISCIRYSINTVQILEKFVENRYMHVLIKSAQ
jgi:hypothetical protein